MTVIKIDEATVKEIERLQYEVEARKDVISQALNGNINMRNEMFKTYHEDYQEMFKAYNKAKQEMTDKYLKGTEYQGKYWNLDFLSGELTIVD